MILDQVYFLENTDYNIISPIIQTMIIENRFALQAKYNVLVKFPLSWRWEYVVEKCPDGYNGSFVKRFKKLFYEHNVTLTNQDLLPIVQALDVDRSPNYSVKFTKASWKAGDFKDLGSCFWGCRYTAPKILRDAGGFACQLLPNLGRCWMLPFRQGYLIFNAYGKRLSFFNDLICKILNLQSYCPTESIYIDEPLYINKDEMYYLTPNGSTLRKDIDLGYISQDAIGEGTIVYCNKCDEYYFPHETCRGCDDNADEF